ncbi:LysR family transcriptional regulator [Williamsia sterculiae]|nr:LysR family transcriptional regulator [Williamsia sterculiae]
MNDTSEAFWFVTLAELENVTAAATALHMSQPTLSRRLRELERTLATPLFDRHGRRLTLNGVGRIYLQRLRRAKAEVDAGRREVADALTPTAGTVRLAFLHSFGVHLVPRLVDRFLGDHPDVAFELSQDAADVVVGQVVDGSADLGLVSPRPAAAGLGWSRVSSQPLALAVTADHRLADWPSAPLIEVSAEPFIVMRPGFGMRHIVDELCAEAGFTPRITFESTDLQTVAGFAATGLGVAVLPVEQDVVPPPGLRLIPLSGAASTRDVGVVWRRGAPLSAAATAFRDLLRDQSVD